MQQAQQNKTTVINAVTFHSQELVFIVLAGGLCQKNDLEVLKKRKVYIDEVREAMMFA